MLSKRIPLRGGVEYDIFTGWRRVYSYTKRPRVCKYVKRAYNKRLRAVHKQELVALTESFRCKVQDLVAGVEVDLNRPLDPRDD